MRSPLLVAAVLLVPLAARGQAPVMSRAWVRTCDEVTPPVPSTDGATVYGCQARFDAALGRYGGRVPIGMLAAVDAERGIAESYGEPGLLLVRLRGNPEARPLARARGGPPEAIAVSPDGARVATLEGAGPGQLALVVRGLPRLQALARVLIENVPPQVVDGADVAFGPDGAVLAAVPCFGARCALPGVMRLDGGRLVSVRGLEGPFTAAAFAKGGAAVALLGAGGFLQVRATAGGAVHGRAELGQTSQETIALSADASLVAAASTERLRVFAVGGETRLVYQQRPGAHEIAFSPTGGRLFLGGAAIAAIAPGPPRVQPVAPPALGITPPAGWTAGVVRDGILTFPSQRGAEYAADDGLVGAWSSREGNGQARVSVTDADELAAYTDTDRWALAAAERYEPYSPLVSPADRRAHGFRVRRDERGQRSMEMHLSGDGCDPSDRWVRIEERGEALVHTTLVVPSGLVEPVRTTAWLRAFGFEARMTTPRGRAVPAL